VSSELVKLYKPEEVAELLGFKDKTVRNWLRTGKLPGLKVGGSWRVREKDLIAFLDSQQQTKEKKEG